MNIRVQAEGTRRMDLGWAYIHLVRWQSCVSVSRSENGDPIEEDAYHLNSTAAGASFPQPASSKSQDWTICGRWREKHWTDVGY